MLIRKPAVAGQFYPGTKDALNKAIGLLVEKVQTKIVSKTRIKGLVLPHAGYVYSGVVAAETVNQAVLADIFIILGPNHTGLGKPFSVMAEGKWQTPLGEASIAQALAGEIVKRSQYLRQDTAAHELEHSIEVILPFLQYFKKDFSFVPIILAHADINILKAMAEDITAAIHHLGLKDKVSVIASSDMTHYETQESASKKDHYAIESMVELDTENLLSRVEQKNISMCGIAPVCVMLEIVKRLGAKKGELIRYQTSGDVTGDYRSVVGYAGISIN